MKYWDFSSHLDDDEHRWHILAAQDQILKHFSLMCFKGSFSKWRSRNYIHYIIERHRPEPRHYCWSMTFKVNDWADRGSDRGMFCFARSVPASHYSPQTHKYALYSCHQPHMNTFYRLRLFWVSFIRVILYFTLSVSLSLPAAHIIDDTSRRFLLYI